MKPTNKLLGAIGLATAPGLFLQIYVCQLAGVTNSSPGGFFDLIYMIGWMCSTVGLLRLRATGTTKAGAVLLYVQLALLAIANAWNVWVIIDPVANSTLFSVLDVFWPLSNACMLITGIVVAVTGKLQGWRRYAVLMAGLWLPVAVGVRLLAGHSTFSFYISGVYSIIAWGFVALAIFTTPAEKEAGL